MEKARHSCVLAVPYNGKLAVFNYFILRVTFLTLVFSFHKKREWVFSLWKTKRGYLKAFIHSIHLRLRVPRYRDSHVKLLRKCTCMINFLAYALYTLNPRFYIFGRFSTALCTHAVVWKGNDGAGKEVVLRKGEIYTRT